jgi:UDP-N-acetyl-D-mannosaminuronate dehydrogenase
MVELAEEINHAAPGYVAERCRLLLNDLKKPVKGSSVLLIGVAYKPNISDQRESPAIPLAKELIDWGANIQYFDTYVPVWAPNGTEAKCWTSVESLERAISEVDVAILLQEHSTVSRETLENSSTPVLDTRGVLSASASVYRL